MRQRLLEVLDHFSRDVWRTEKAAHSGEPIIFQRAIEALHCSPCLSELPVESSHQWIFMRRFHLVPRIVMVYCRDTFQHCEAILLR